MRIGFLGLLTLLFVAAKLFGYIAWSWWLVFLPFYGPLALYLAFVVIVGLGALVIAALSTNPRRRR